MAKPTAKPRKEVTVTVGTRKGALKDIGGSQSDQWNNTLVNQAVYSLWTGHSEGRRESLNQASKLSRTSATLIEALNRHRGKGQQKVTVEHVHVHSGGQAVVGMIAPTSALANSEEPNAKQVAHAPQPALRREDPSGWGPVAAMSDV